MPDNLGNIYFLSWALFYLRHHNRNLYLAYTKLSLFLSWLSGFTELAQYYSAVVRYPGLP